MKIIIKQLPWGKKADLELASDYEDIVIDFGTSYHDAVGLPSTFNIDWTKHKSLSAAIKRYAKLFNQGYAPTLLDKEGNEAYIVNGEVFEWMEAVSDHGLIITD